MKSLGLQHPTVPDCVCVPRLLVLPCCPFCVCTCVCVCACVPLLHAGRRTGSSASEMRAGTALPPFQTPTSREFPKMQQQLQEQHTRYTPVNGATTSAGAAMCNPTVHDVVVSSSSTSIVSSKGVSCCVCMQMVIPLYPSLCVMPPCPFP